MKSALTPKQSAFCLKYIETGNASEAYRICYDIDGMKPATINRAAKQLLDNPKITTRLATLRESHIKRHNVTIDSLVDELEEARELGRELQKPEVMITATLGKAKVTGLSNDTNVNVTLNRISRSTIRRSSPTTPRIMPRPTDREAIQRTSPPETGGLYPARHFRP